MNVFLFLLLQPDRFSRQEQIWARPVTFCLFRLLAGLWPPHGLVFPAECSVVPGVQDLELGRRSRQYSGAQFWGSLFPFLHLLPILQADQGGTQDPESALVYSQSI